jgi:hypothetical protein
MEHMENTDIPDRISSTSLERIGTLNFLRDAATRAGIDCVVGMVEPDGTIRVTSNYEDSADERTIVTDRLQSIKRQRDAAKANRPSDETLASDLSLWREHIDPYYIYTDDEFRAVDISFKLEYIRTNGL